MQKDPKEQSLLESFVSVGTPLPSLATAKGDSQEFKPIWEQEVVDEKGRRRFHGAFTGGFTAGYYGTVGSKEGWTPSTFKSSRSDRAGDRSKTTAQLAEDLMDEEDLAELQSSRTLSTAAAYTAPPPQAYDPLLGNFLPTAPAEPLPATAALASLIEPASTRIGAQLMRRMGWRDGQGVGPRVTLQQRRKQAAELGIKLEGDEGDDEDNEAARHYFAPLDRPLATVTEVGVATDRGWGLGYKPGPSIASTSAKVAKKDSAYGGARMTGDQDDDEEVYDDGQPATGPTKSWGVVDIDEDDSGVTLLGMESRPTKPLRKPTAAPTPLQSFHDGTRVVPGFVLFRDVLPGQTSAELPPSAPRGWVPNPSKVWKENVAVGADAKGKGKQLDALERGTLLGEPAPPPVPKSVFDYLSARDKERLASLSRSDPKASTSTAPHPVAEPDATLVIPPLDKPTAVAALKGFQPFSAASTSPDPVRQGRYTLYLQLQAGLLPPSNATLPFGPRKLPSGLVQTISDLNRELDDYMRAARVFKPVSGLLAGRFTSGGAGGPAPVAEPGLYQPIFTEKDPNAPPDGPSASLEPLLIEHLTPAQNAARSGMFGPLTRTTESWRPTKLVCKRFGVKDPWDGAEPNGESDVGGAWKEATRTGFGQPGGRRTEAAIGKSSMDALMQSSGFRRFQPEEPPSPPPPEETEWTAPDSAGAPSKPPIKKEAPTLASVGLGDDEAQGSETLTYTKAPKDIFAAIFADSEDEEDDDEEEDEVVPDPPQMVQAGEIAIVPAAAPAPEQAPEVAVADELAEVPLSSSTISSYRPTFTPAPKGGDVDTIKPKGEEKKKKKRKSHTALSFDVEEGGEEETFKPKSKKRGGHDLEKGVKKKRAPEEEVVEWVEIAQPAALVAPVAGDNPSTMTLPKGARARAVDLYD